jgi:hypothetical protein
MTAPAFWTVSGKDSDIAVVVRLYIPASVQRAGCKRVVPAGVVA